MPEIALNPPPFNPHGEKGEFGRPGARNGRWHAEACQQTYPCEAARGRDARAPRACDDARAPTRRQHRPKFISVARDCGRAVMTTAPLRCTFAPHPPCPLLPHGEKGEFGRPDALGTRASGAQAGETRAPPGDALGTRASGAHQAGRDAPVIPPVPRGDSVLLSLHHFGRPVMTVAPV